MKLAAAEELFNQALELATPAERDGFLRKLEPDIEQRRVTFRARFD